MEVDAPWNGSIIATIDTAGRGRRGPGAGDRARVSTGIATAGSPGASGSGSCSVRRRSCVKRHEQLATESAREGGKPLDRLDWSRSTGRSTASAGVHQCPAQLRLGHGIPMNLNAASAHRIAYHPAMSPSGSSLAFSAFNHPVNLIVHQVFPGCRRGLSGHREARRGDSALLHAARGDPARGGAAEGVVPGPADLRPGRVWPRW